MQPNGVFVDTHGNVWVADTHNARIQKWKPGATKGETIEAGLPNAPTFPTTLVVCHEGNIYVADYFQSKVKMLSKNATKWITVAGDDNAMDLTRGVWVDKDTNVYATDYGHNRILKYAPGNSTGVVVAGGNGYGSALNQIARPVSVFVDRKGNIYVTDQDNNRIMKWKKGATSGEVVAGGNGAGNAANQLNSPDFVFVDANKNVHIADRQNDRIQVWAENATEGITEAGGNGTGSAANQFNQPYGSFVDNNNYLYVGDHENDRVQRFDLNSLALTAVKNSKHDVADLIKADNNAKASAYPNPAKNSTVINYIALNNNQHTLIITDAGGKIILQKLLTSRKGINQVTIDLSRFTKGLYFANIIAPDKTKQVIKIMKE